MRRVSSLQFLWRGVGIVPGRQGTSIQCFTVVASLPSTLQRRICYSNFLAHGDAESSENLYFSANCYVLIS